MHLLYSFKQDHSDIIRNSEILKSQTFLFVFQYSVFMYTLPHIHACMIHVIYIYIYIYISLVIPLVVGIPKLKLRYLLKQHWFHPHNICGSWVHLFHAHKWTQNTWSGEDGLIWKTKFHKQCEYHKLFSLNKLGMKSKRKLKLH